MTKKQQENTEQKSTNYCGIVMPISSIEECDEAHWIDVRNILYTAVEAANFTPRIVSESDDGGLIHRRIVQNLYNDPIIICDVSCKNPNVMFELGLRLAFDKPTIIIIDDKTSYSFDTGIIEHISYPRDLRFSSIQKFQEELTRKVTATYEKSSKDASYTPFLKHFGELNAASLGEIDVAQATLIMDEVAGLKRMIQNFGKNDKYEIGNQEYKTILNEVARDMKRHKYSEDKGIVQVRDSDGNVVFVKKEI